MKFGTVSIYDNPGNPLLHGKAYKIYAYKDGSPCVVLDSVFRKWLQTSGGRVIADGLTLLDRSLQDICRIPTHLLGERVFQAVKEREAVNAAQVQWCRDTTIEGSEGDLSYVAWVEACLCQAIFNYLMGEKYTEILNKITSVGSPMAGSSMALPQKYGSFSCRFPVNGQSNCWKILSPSYIDLYGIDVNLQRNYAIQGNFNWKLTKFGHDLDGNGIQFDGEVTNSGIFIKISKPIGVLGEDRQISGGSAEMVINTAWKIIHVTNFEFKKAKKEIPVENELVLPFEEI
jgi:hypothetical protein